MAHKVEHNLIILDKEILFQELMFEDGIRLPIHLLSSRSDNYIAISNMYIQLYKIGYADFDIHNNGLLYITFNCNVRIVWNHDNDYYKKDEPRPIISPEYRRIIHDYLKTPHDKR